MGFPRKPELDHSSTADYDEGGEEEVVDFTRDRNRGASCVKRTKSAFWIACAG